MHHAYVYEGTQNMLEALGADARKLFKFAEANDPDVQVRRFEKFGIDDAAGLKAATSLRSVSGRALWVIGIGSITVEAQQALLKLFEEPQEGVTFVLLVPHGALIATLRSRTLPYPHELEGARGTNIAKKFLSEAPKSRSAAVAALLKDDEGARERARELLDGLEGELYRQLQKSKGKSAYREGLEDIAKVRSYLSDRSPSLKMLLEHLAATLPKP